MHGCITAFLALLLVRSECARPRVTWELDDASNAFPTTSAIPFTRWAVWEGRWRWLSGEECRKTKNGVYFDVRADGSFDERLSGTYRAGVRVEPLDVTRCPPNQELASVELRLDDGRLFGATRRWHFVMPIMLRGETEERFDGTRWTRQWGASGVPRSEGASVDSTRVDTWSYWDELGQPVAQGSFGGTWTFWNVDGSVDASRSGRGLSDEDAQRLEGD